MWNYLKTVLDETFPVLSMAQIRNQSQNCFQNCCRIVIITTKNEKNSKLSFFFPSTAVVSLLSSRGPRWSP